MDFYKTEQKPNTIRMSYMVNCIWCGHTCIDSDTCPACDKQLEVGGIFLISGFLASPVWAEIENTLALPEIRSINQAEFWYMYALSWSKLNDSV